MTWLKDWWKVITGIVAAVGVATAWVYGADQIHKEVPPLKEAVQSIAAQQQQQADALDILLKLCRSGDLDPESFKCKKAEEDDFLRRKADDE